MAMQMMSSDVKKHNETVLLEAVPGDRLKFDRGAYDHWGVYAGEGKVVHRTGEDGQTQNNSRHASSAHSVQDDKAVVKMENFWKVAGNSKVFIDNTLDSKYNPLPREQIVENALQSVGRKGYNILYNNCEHFANSCRFNVSESEQVSNLLFGLSVAAVGIAAGIISVCRLVWKRKNKHVE